jgi:hypothetical protein
MLKRIPLKKLNSKNSDKNLKRIKIITNDNDFLDLEIINEDIQQIIDKIKSRQIKVT